LRSSPDAPGPARCGTLGVSVELPLVRCDYRSNGQSGEPNCLRLPGRKGKDRAQATDASPCGYDSGDEQTRRAVAPTIELKPRIGPRAFQRKSESVVRQLQAGDTVTVEMTVRTNDRGAHAASMRILQRLVWLVEGVGEVQMFDIREQMRPKVVLVPIPPPSAAESSMPCSPDCPADPTSGTCEAPTA